MNNERIKQLCIQAKSTYKDIIVLAYNQYNKLAHNLDSICNDEKDFFVFVDIYMQALLMKVALSDNHFSDNDACIITMLPKYGDMFHDYNLIDMINCSDREMYTLGKLADEQLAKVPYFLHTSLSCDAAFKTDFTSAYLTHFVILASVLELLNEGDDDSTAMEAILPTIQYIIQKGEEYGVDTIEIDVEKFIYIDNLTTIESPTKLLDIKEVFHISQGTILNGMVEAEKVCHNQTVMLRRKNGTSKKVTIAGIELFRELIDYAEYGDYVGILIKGLSRNDVEAGDILEYIP